MEAQLPPKWKTLTINRYNGLLDPNEHVDTYVTQMNFFTDDDVIMSLVFPTTLKDDQIIARECYTASLRIGKGKNVIEPKSQLVECTSLNSNLGEAELDP
ncbi:hypothetical protein JHK82_052605 [Glycine max]|nr:hypothetical protein JHK86_052452 [Glycine max]KAG5082454.1 hypothetical protein JHK84_052492 [Glycine max]KAG5085208.1 hypothetical protein JHK82_052605 [Glycine max]